MGRMGIVKDILLYFILPEDSTEAGGGVGLLAKWSLLGRQAWLGPLKTLMWTGVAVAAPVLLFAVLS